MIEQKPNLTLVSDEPAPAEQPAQQPMAQLTDAVPLAARRKAAREFKEWKQQLTEMIRRKASIIWSAQGGKLVYHFVLPSDLVKLVWNTTIKERVKMEEMQGGAEGAVKRAIEGIRSEVDAATGAIVQQRREAATQAIQQTVDHLTNHPPFAGQKEAHAEAEPISQAQAPTEGNAAPVEEPQV